MTIETVLEDSRWAEVGIEGLAQRAASATLVRMTLDLAVCEIAFLACNDSRIAELNASFRDKFGATNVLSWPSEERGAPWPGEMPEPPEAGLDGVIELGDIAISYDTCAREAEAAGLPLSAHATHLIVHGVLHLLGFDHIREADARLMEGIEVEILGKMGLKNPYDRE
ncbi:rRNA maturation RNase YbeY [Aestuariibius sp. 2305UL40-4]|uniref:rRNA maturation RNase YbeY n=1 Tax=Aestuariibius violaceus TaxID=3234132 RepID=UPI00345E707C